MAGAQAFVAYPSGSREIRDCIRDAVEGLNAPRTAIEFRTWEQNDIAGRPLTAPIFSGIEDARLLVADITKLNFNVTYEIGYSIGLKKRVYLIQNTAIVGDSDKATKVGIFDTLGYNTYHNSNGLIDLLARNLDLTPLRISSAQDRSAPLYLLETPQRSQAMVRIIARVKKARLQYRSFAPSEETRLSAVDAIDHISSSYGVLVPLLSMDMVDADIHNIRAAFIAGLAHGMSKPTLILQNGEGPVPLDLRDFARTYTQLDDINDHVQDLALNVYAGIQDSVSLDIPEGSILARLAIGDPMAENEFQTLGNYYLPTDQFNRALRGEVNLVVGRKGTGKTALFSQVRNKLRQNRKIIVVDLKPEGYQLIKLKEDVLDFISEGAKTHLITAFWEYLLYLEVCYKILEKDQDRHLRDLDLYENYIELQNLYYKDPNTTEGDFSERLLSLSQNIAQSYKEKHGNEENVRLTTDEITNLIHSENLRELRNRLYSYLDLKDGVWILFDNLDKGWSSHGLARGDIVILRCLIDASRKIQRDMQKADLEFHSVIFVRNDVYQLLMDQTPDFGKEMRASLDWSDPDLLREMLRKRLIQNDLPEHAEFQQLWGRICVTHYKGEETSEYFINRSFMRPRNLLKIFAHCRGFAVNLDHNKIEETDITKGLRSYSNDLIIDADQELTDIEPVANNLIYHFIGEKSQYTIDGLKIILRGCDIPENKVESVIEFLLYYGFLGIADNRMEPTYIFNVGYDMKILRTVIQKKGSSILYALNPAFWPALSIEPN